MVAYALSTNGTTSFTGVVGGNRLVTTVGGTVSDLSTEGIAAVMTLGVTALGTNSPVEV